MPGEPSGLLPEPCATVCFDALHRASRDRGAAAGTRAVPVAVSASTTPRSDDLVPRGAPRSAPRHGKRRSRRARHGARARRTPPSAPRSLRRSWRRSPKARVERCFVRLRTPARVLSWSGARRGERSPRHTNIGRRITVLRIGDDAHIAGARPRGRTPACASPTRPRPSPVRGALGRRDGVSSISKRACWPSGARRFRWASSSCGARRGPCE